MQQRASSYERGIAPEEVPLRDYLLIVIGKWWVVAAVFAVVVVVAGFYSSRAPNVYETRTKLLIVPTVSERLIGTDRTTANPVGTSLSVETLSALATANDLLQDIIAALDLRDSATGRLWGVEGLAGMLKPKVETAGRGGAQASLPLLTMTVSGGDPKLVKQVADKWAEVFVRRNAQLFATEAARSYDFVASQYQETQTALQARQVEKLAYQKANPLPSLQSQAEVNATRHREFLSRLQSDRAALAEAQGRLAYYEAALDGLRRKRAERSTFEKANPLGPLQGELEVLTTEYQAFLSNLQRKQAALVETTARAQSLSAALAAEPRVISLKRSIPNESLFTVLGGNVSADKLKALGSLELTDEQPNPTYLSLKALLDAAQTAVAAYTAEVRDLQTRTAELKARIEQLSARAADVRLKASEFDDDIAILRSGAAIGSGGEGSLTASLAVARADVARLNTSVADLVKRTEQLDTENQRLLERIAQGQVDVARFDRDIVVLTENFNRLARSLQEARIAREEQVGSIRIVEGAVEPQTPIARDTRRRILVAGLAGLLLGVVAAFVLHSLQGPPRPQPASQPPQSDAPTS